MTNPTQAAIRDSYEKITYIAGPHAATHPSRLATVAGLLGLETADPERCRVLEIGCATGGNILPMAEAAPNSEFVGFDLSPSQVAMGVEMAESIGLTNVKLETLDILDVDDPVGRWGAFDYIICHGVYSWVPLTVREQILKICKQALTPNGVAYVSYNTYPGSQTRDLARGVALFGSRHVLQEERSVPQVFAFWEAVADAMPHDDHVIKIQLEQARQKVKEAPEYYIAHEYLEDVNEPLWFYEFVDSATAAGLQYLGDAMGGSEDSDLPPETQQAFAKMAPSLVALQQFVDLASNTSFRRTLLCHAEAEVPRSPRPGTVEKLYVVATSKRVSEDDEGRVKFKSRQGREFTTNIPLLVSALDIAYEAWPEPMGVLELFERASRAEAVQQAPDSPSDLAFFLPVLVQLWLKGALGLTRTRVQVTNHIGERPRVGAYARAQVVRGMDPTNLLHQQAVLKPEDLQLVPFLDGTRDMEGLQAVWKDLDRERPDEDGESDALIDSLKRLAKGGFLYRSPEDQTSP